MAQVRIEETKTEVFEPQLRVKIEVFTSPTCPHCPHAKKAVADFAKDRKDVKFVETSTYSSAGQKRAANYGIRSVPTLIITGPGTAERIGYVGTPSKNQLERMTNIALGKDEFPQQENIFTKIMNKFKK